MGKKPLRVGNYVRVSTGDQRTENQLRDLQAVAAQRGWDVVEVYEDHAISGSKGRDQRPGFGKLATDAAKGRINYIAAWALDRPGRSSRDVINFITDLPEQGVGLYLHREQLDAGLRRARAKGTKLGRPTSVTPRTEKRIRAMLKEGCGKLRIARELGVGVGTVERLAAA